MQGQRPICLYTTFRFPTVLGSAFRVSTSSTKPSAAPPRAWPFCPSVSQPHLHQHRPCTSRYVPGPIGHYLCSGTGSWPLSMETLSPAKRGCRFQDESEGLLFHKHYSRTSCVFECSLKKAADELQCVPWYLPQMPGVMPCRFNKLQSVSLPLSLIFDSSTKTARFNDVMARVGTESCDCLPDCDSTEYQYAVTSSSLRWGVFLEINK